MSLSPVCRIILFCGLITPAASGQATISLSSGAAVEGESVNLNLNLSGVNSPASLQFKLTFLPAQFKSVEVAVGTAAKAARKSVACHPIMGAVTCLIWGQNAIRIKSGVVAVVRATLATGASGESYPIKLEEVTGVSAAGATIRMHGMAGAVRVIRTR